MGDSVSAGSVAVAADVFAPGHLGELGDVLDVELVDAVLAEAGAEQKRVRLLPSRVVVYFVLALALFEGCGYRAVWGKLVVGLGGLAGRAGRPTASALCQARRRVGPAPLRALFDAVAGPVAQPGTAGAFWRGLRTAALDATTLRVPDAAAVRAVCPKRGGAAGEFGYPLLRLSVLAECGTRALLGAVFGPDTVGERAYAQRLTGLLRAGMLVLADRGYDGWQLFAEIAETGAHYLARARGFRTLLRLRALPDGSYESVIGYGKLKVRVIEARITVAYADGTTRVEAWRLITSLLDWRAYPAEELVALYHRRWEVETAYFSIKNTILDGRVLRSRAPAEIDQEVWALLAVYQALVRLSADAVAAGAGPGVQPGRASLTVALHAARDQVVLAARAAGALIGAIGRVVLADLAPARRQRAKPRTRKNATSKYAPKPGKTAAKSLDYTLRAQVMIIDDWPDSPRKRLTTRQPR